MSISKKRIHQLTRMGGLESNRRIQNKYCKHYNENIVPIKVRKKNRISLRAQGRITTELPISTKVSLSNQNLEVVKSYIGGTDNYIGKKQGRILQQLRKQYMKNIKNIPIMRERIKKNPLLEPTVLVRSSDHQVNSAIAKRLKRRLNRMSKTTTRITIKGRTIVIPPMD